MKQEKADKLNNEIEEKVICVKLII